MECVLNKMKLNLMHLNFFKGNFFSRANSTISLLNRRTRACKDIKTHEKTCSDVGPPLLQLLPTLMKKTGSSSLTIAAYVSNTFNKRYRNSQNSLH